MSEQVSVSLLAGDVIIGRCGIEFWHQYPSRIQVTLEDGRRFDAEADDLTSALADIRRQLLEKGLDLACQGCRKDVMASGMSIDSTGGSSLYRLRMGVPARRADVVRLFDDAQVDDVATLEEQASYRRDWLASLGPTDGEVAEARNHPNGWIYRIDGRLDPAGDVPPQAIVGAWKVDGSGEIVGSFEINDNYRPDELELS